MKNTIARAALITLALTGAWIPTASATGPFGVFVHVSKVVYDNPVDPTTIEIHGAMLVHNGDMTTMWPGYSNPAEGYMYYTCPAGMKATCQLEWKDIAANVGTAITTCVGYGSDTVPLPGTLRSECDAPKNPDMYPISIGVQPAFGPCQVIAAYLMNKPDGGCGASSSSTTTGSSSSGAQSSSSNAASSGSGAASSGSGTGGAGGGSSSGGNTGCACEAAPKGSMGLFGLALPALAAGIALRRRAARRGAR